MTRLRTFFLLMTVAAFLRHTSPTSSSPPEGPTPIISRSPTVPLPSLPLHATASIPLTGVVTCSHWHRWSTICILVTLLTFTGNSMGAGCSLSLTFPPPWHSLPSGFLCPVYSTATMAHTLILTLCLHFRRRSIRTLGLGVTISTLSRNSIMTFCSKPRTVTCCPISGGPSSYSFLKCDLTVLIIETLVLTLGSSSLIILFCPWIIIVCNAGSFHQVRPALIRTFAIGFYQGPICYGPLYLKILNC